MKTAPSTLCNTNATKARSFRAFFYPLLHRKEGGGIGWIGRSTGKRGRHEWLYCTVGRKCRIGNCLWLNSQIMNNLWRKVLTGPIWSAILAIIKNCGSIEVRCASVFSASGIGIPAGKKGQTAEVFFDSRSKNAGPMENIPRTVTKVERYHSSSLGHCAIAVNVGVFQDSRFFVFQKKGRKENEENHKKSAPADHGSEPAGLLCADGQRS